MAEINREHKDRLFRFIFGNPENKEWTLSLYNAINGSNYSNPDDITITTIKDVLYMDMKNDLSVLVSASMDLYEQQSTYNPNTPIRFFIYAGMIYGALFESSDNKLNIYSSRIQMLPVPKCVCFYNGQKDVDDYSELYLSSAFPEGSDPDISVRVRMININYGHNMELLNQCRPLYDYSFLIARIRFFQDQNFDIQQSVDMAMDELSDDSVIKPFLIQNKAEVRRMCITEYDEVRTMNMFKEEGREEEREEMFENIVNCQKNGIITIEQAAAIAGMTLEEYLEKMTIVRK